MLRFTFRHGLVLLQGQQRWEIRRRTPTHKIQLENEAGEIQSLTNAELNQKWMSGEWVIDEKSIGSRSDSIYLTTPRDLSTFPQAKQAEARRRMRYLETIKPENGYRQDEWRQIIRSVSQELGDECPPGPSTVYKWWSRYRQTKSVISLVPHRSEKRMPAQGKGKELFEEAISRVYMTNQSLPKIAVFEEICRLAAAVNKSSAGDLKIKPPSRATVYRWIAELRQDLVDVARDGAEVARVKYRAALGSIKLTSILERVEIDHTPVDLIVIDRNSKLTLGRPWLTLAVDVFSRMIVGFYISFKAPSSYSVLMCLKMAMLPKDTWVKQYTDIKQQWPAHGIPELIAVDNGADFHSEAFEATCLEMGIEILYSGAKTPQHKGVIERLFRTLNSGLIHRLPGSVFSNINARGDYPAEDKAVIDIETLTYLVTKWIVEIYNVSHHKGIGTTPLDAWMQSASRRVIELPVYPQYLDVITGIPAKRTIFHYGIELQGLHYNSEQLQLYRRRIGGNERVEIKLHEDEVGYIHVYDKFEKVYIKVPAKLIEYAEGVSREVHREIREQARVRMGDRCPSERLLEVRAEMEREIQERIHDKKMATRKKAARVVMRDSDSANTSHIQAPETRRTKKSEASESLPSGLSDELPVFDEGGL